MLDRKASSLDGKTAVVTGGGGGIGRGIAETFAAHGARVVVAERDPSRARETLDAIRKAGGQAVECVVDVQERAGASRLLEATLSAFGGIDVLVNNVGDFLGSKPFVQTDENDWEAQYRINLKHVFYCSHAFVPKMIEQGRGGSIINLSTIEAFRGIPNCAVYSAFNCGVTGFTKSLALELGPQRIRVNAIAPETTETLQVPIRRWLKPEHLGREPYWIPLGRFGTPDDHAGAALFLASELSAWVTGTTIHVDGGALAAGGFYRTPDGDWSNLPVVTEGGIATRTRDQGRS